MNQKNDLVKLLDDIIIYSVRSSNNKDATLIVRNEEIADAIIANNWKQVPCNAGDQIFFICEYEEKYFLNEGTVDGVSFQKDGIWVHARYASGLTYWHKAEDTDIFFEREKAEKKLEMLKEEKRK